MRAVTLAPIHRYTAANLIKFVHRFGKAPNKEDARCNPEGEHQSKECKVPPTTKKLSGSGNGDGGGHDDKTNNSKIKHKKQNKIKIEIIR